VIINYLKTNGGQTMLRKRKKTLTLKVFVVFLSLAMTTAGFAASGDSARVIPTRKVYIIENGQIVGEFSNEAPLPEGSLLRCEDKCAVKMDDAYMVVDPGTEFSVTPAANSTELFVKTGTVYFAINESSRPIHITTPSGDATTGDLTMTDSELRGYARVSGNETEIGVIGGGIMMLETASGEMAVTTGNAVTIAAIGEGSPSASGGNTGGLTRNQKIGIGVATAAVLIAGGVALATSGGGGGGSGGGGGGGDDGSPAAP
jgi:hypothetical protein